MEIVDKLIINGSNIWHVNKYGETLLHYAVRNTNTEVLKRLLFFGLDGNKQDIYGYTPLMRAVINNCKEGIEIFLEHRIDTTIKNNEEKKAIDYAKNEEIKELLNQYSS